MLRIGLGECLVRLLRHGCLLRRRLRRGDIAEGGGQGVDYRKSSSRAHAEHYQPNHPTGEAKQGHKARLAGAGVYRHSDKDGAYHHCGKSSNKYPG